MQDPQLGHRSARWGPLPPARTYCPFFLLMSPPSLARPSDRRPFAPARRSRAGQRWPGRKRARPPAPEASPGVGSAAPAGQPAWGHPQGLRTPGRASPSSVSIATQGVPHRPASPVPHPEWGKGASRARKGPGRPQPPEALLRPAPSTTKLGGGLCGREWGAEKGELQEQAKWRGLVRRGAGGGPGKGAGGGAGAGCGPTPLLRAACRAGSPSSGPLPGRPSLPAAGAAPFSRASPSLPSGPSLPPGPPSPPLRPPATPASPRSPASAFVPRAGAPALTRVGAVGLGALGGARRLGLLGRLILAAVRPRLHGHHGEVGGHGAPGAPATPRPAPRRAPGSAPPAPADAAGLGRRGGVRAAAPPT